jgi:rhodanese-related sulfurtransferase
MSRTSGSLSERISELMGSRSTTLQQARAGDTAAGVAEVRTVTPQEAAALLADGYVYVDVRSEPEFEAGHVPGALNVPISHQGPGGLTPNPEFLSVIQQAFATSERLVVGCKAGGRSKRAVEQLAGAGYQELADMSAGWDGSRDAFGRVTPGWSKQGLSVEQGKPPGQAYADVKQRTPRSG